MESYVENYKIICDKKSKAFSEMNYQFFYKSLSNIYNAICLDIDDTITYNENNQEEKRTIINSLAKITKKNVIICFITGRGKTNAFEFLERLKKEIVNSDQSITEKHFRRWYCITNNGYMLYYFDYINNVFLGLNTCLVTNETKIEYTKFKKEFRNEIASFLSRRLEVDIKEVLENSDKSSSENSLRFPFDVNYEKSIDYDLIHDVREMVKCRAKNYPFGVCRGKYIRDNKIVIEVSMTNKGTAIDKVEKILGIPKEKMLRIGDQGDYLGNDYEMLNCSSGFSVGNFSENPCTCFPFIENSEVVIGVKGTANIINHCKIFPTVCLETPDIEIYTPKLARSERKNINANKDSYKYYENLISLSFKTDTSMLNDVNDFIEPITGGFYIHDWEYHLLKVENPNHILFKIYDEKVKNIKGKQPYLKYCMKTDNGLLLRGPLNYYYGLAFRNFKNKQISKDFIRKLNQNRIKFLQLCIDSLKTNKINIKNSIDKRVLLGILDSVRDYLLFNINMYLDKLGAKKDILYFYHNSNSKIDVNKKLAKQNLIYMYNCLFGNLNADFVEQIVCFLNLVLNESKNTTLFIDKLNNTKFYNNMCRVWREIDSFYENIIAMDTAIKNLLNESSIKDKEYLFYGIRYGAIELSLIIDTLLETSYKFYNLKYKVGILSINSKYEQNHSEVREADLLRQISLYRNENVTSINNVHILMDDNLVTGKTVQTCINLLVNSNIYVDKIFVVRYPALNRIKQMFLPNHGAPDTDLFWQFIFGLTSPTPYTRLNDSYVFKKRPNEKYLDELGEFNKARTFVLNLIFKNGFYNKESEADRNGQN